MFVVDYNHLSDKLKIGDTILIDYGGVILKVIGFESEEKFLK